jgi:hypothetical protein
MGQVGKINKPEKISEKNQRAKMRTKGPSKHPPPKLSPTTVETRDSLRVLDYGKKS